MVLIWLFKKKFPLISTEAFDAIKKQHFNPLFEERLTVKQQHKALEQIADHYDEPLVRILTFRLLEMHFFDLR